MAIRRMISSNVVSTDKFKLDLEFSQQALYFQLVLAADDDGFVQSPRSIAISMRARDEDLLKLARAGYIILFETGSVGITDWTRMNKIQPSRKVSTELGYEASLVSLDETTGRYVLKDDKPMLTCGDSILSADCRQDDDNLSAQYSIGKYSIGKYSREEREICAPAKPAGGASRSKFTPPTVEDVRSYCREKGYTFSPEAFIGYYESNGWKVGKNPMKSWKGACASWQGRQGVPASPPNKEPTFEEDGYRINERGEVEYQYAHGERDANGTVHVHFD